MKIKFNGIEPNARYYRMGVQQNNLFDDLEFELAGVQSGIDLSAFKPFLKLSTTDLSFIDKDGNIEITPSGDKLLLRYKLQRDILLFNALDMQIQFERYDEYDVVIWQSLMFNIAFNKTIGADKAIAARNPEILQDLNRRVGRLENLPPSGIMEKQSKSDFPAVGQAGIVYIDKSANMCYRFDDDKKIYYVVGSDYNDIKIINGNGGY